jgi:hypothetical protein
VKRSVNRSACTNKRKVGFSRVVMCSVCTFSVLEGQMLDFLRKIGKLQNTTMCCFDTRCPLNTAFEVHEWIYNVLMLEKTETLMVQMDGHGARFTLSVGFRFLLEGILSRTCEQV